jgi:hypothetical protein
MADRTDKILDTKNKGIDFIKSKVFDVISLAIVVAMTALSLGVIELRDLSYSQWANIIIECIPFYLAATMLSVNYYTKGSFKGKNTDKYISAIQSYSDTVTNLSGEEINYLHEFCTEYNEKTLHDIQLNMLKSVAITWQMYNDGVGEEKPLKAMSKSELLKKYNKDIVNVILKCKKCKIKGINANILLGNLHNSDSTDIGLNEKQLANKRTLSYASNYIFTIFFMSLMAVKNVLQWGWMGAFLTVFKVTYVAIYAYTKYFNGYEDITFSVTNHIYRKIDIIKEFRYWYNKRTVLQEENSLE